MTTRAKHSPLSLREITAKLGGEVAGENVQVNQVASIDYAVEGEITFLVNKRLGASLGVTKASAVILRGEDKGLTHLPKIITKDPYLYFAKISSLFNPPSELSFGISKSASISRAASVPKEVSIGHNVTISSGASIGKYVEIQANSFIGRDVLVGEGSKVLPNVTILQGCIIGENVIIHPGAVIGGDGFGIAREEEKWIKIPQIGRVIIGNNCEIGSGTTIDRGALDNTIVEDGVKLDNQIQIGHNCRVGSNTAIAACVGIAGSVKIGSNCQIGGGAKISGHLEIGENVVISGGTFVAKSITAADRYTGVFPTTRHKDWKRGATIVRNIKSLFDKVKKIEKKLNSR